MSSTITTPQDVVDFTSSDIQLSIGRLCPFIDVEEEAIFNTVKCLGWDYYEYLKSDLFLPTISPVIYEDYTLYFVGDYVSYQDRIYECIADTTGQQSPENSNNFAKIPKFISTASNDIWGRYLAKMISWSVLVRFTDDLAINYTSQGAIRNKGENFNPASIQEIEVKKRGYITARKELVSNMEKFLERNKDLYPQTNYYKEKCGATNCSEAFNSNGFYRKFGFPI